MGSLCAPIERSATMYATPQTDALRIALDYGDAIPVFAHWLGSWRVSVHRRALSAAELARSYGRVAPTWEHTLARLDYPNAYEFLLQRLLVERLPSHGRETLRTLAAGTGTGELACGIRGVCLPTAPGSFGA